MFITVNILTKALDGVKIVSERILTLPSNKNVYAEKTRTPNKSAILKKIEKLTSETSDELITPLYIVVYSISAFSKFILLVASRLNLARHLEHLLV